MTIQQIQRHIITNMKKEKDRKKVGQTPSEWRTSVHFVPSIGRYCYDDKAVPEDAIYPLIEDGTFIFKGIGMHQSERCPQYTLS